LTAGRVSLPVGVFEVEDTKAILKAGQSAGWKLNFHAEEFVRLHSVEVTFSCP